ncbi:glycosyltransferase family 4 protein [Bdellovibrio bacteriovorus]|uniref:glycosyltransferase family 4 protein n=1 Tax=Bdellovibrio bacteriovorus TaxID=959 RepID=UPI0035A5EC14
MKMIMDCSTSSSWTGPLVGIPRVEVELLHHLSQKCQVKPVVYDGSSSMWNWDAEDLIVSFGATWNYQGWLDVVETIKKNKMGRYVHLIHDLIPIKFPYLYEPRFDLNFANWLCRTVKAADLLLCPSESTRRDLCEFINENNLNRVRIETIRLGDVGFSNPKDSIATAGLSGEKYFLMVGTLEQRKNHQVIFDAIRILEKRHLLADFYLVVVGREGWLPNNLTQQLKEDEILKRRVRYFSNLNDLDMKRVVQEASFSVFPSIYEGWGLPVAESLALGVPVIAANNSSLLEIAPNLTTHVDSYNAMAWADAIAQWIQNPGVLNEKRNAVELTYIATPWERTADRIYELMREVIRG